MKGNDILRMLLDVVLLVAVVYVAWHLIKYVMRLVAAGTSILVALIYLFAPLIIIGLLIAILIKVSKK
ncbi:MAG: hypothetical protein IKX74_04085 [Erysipelotrichaceae bacterium]|nr:hypothetical protein [Erysipelotrichaceae bacterium]MBR5048799.1 hypothetical protein [Erysipelotrichaceae bacterium]